MGPSALLGASAGTDRWWAHALTLAEKFPSVVGATLALIVKHSADCDNPLCTFLCIILRERVGALR